MVMDTDWFLFEQKGKMDLYVFLSERKKRVKDIAKIKSPHERLRQLEGLEKWSESVHRLGWVIGHRLVATEKLRAKKEFCLNRKGSDEEIGQTE